MGYYGNKGLNFALDLVVIFLGIPNFPILWGKKIKNIRDFGFKDVMEICVGCFLVYPFSGSLFLIKNGKSKY